MFVSEETYLNFQPSLTTPTIPTKHKHDNKNNNTHTTRNIILEYVLFIFTLRGMSIGFGNENHNRQYYVDLMKPWVDITKSDLDTSDVWCRGLETLK